MRVLHRVVLALLIATASLLGQAKTAASLTPSIHARRGAQTATRATPASISAVRDQLGAASQSAPRGMLRANLRARTRRGASAVVSQPPYSSFECAGGGSQVVDFDKKESFFYGSDIDATDRRTRVCKLRNVCVVGGRLTYYMDSQVEGAAPAGMRMSAFPDGGPVCVGLLPQASCVGEHVVAVDIVSSPRPHHLPFSHRGRVHMLDVLGDASNWAHIMFDTLLPAYSAADLFGDSVADVQIVALNNCSNYADRPALAHKRATMSAADMESACVRNMAAWAPAFFDHPIVQGGGPDVCYRQLVMGHSHIFGLGYWYPHRAVAIRTARDRMYRLHGVAGADGAQLGPALRRHHVMVWRKRTQWTPQLRPDVDMCSVVRRWLANVTVDFVDGSEQESGGRHDSWGATVGPATNHHRASHTADVQLSCLSPADMSVRDQIVTASRATVVVSEEGSTTYLGLFQRPGSSMVVVGSKEMYILFSSADVQVWFADAEAVLPPRQQPDVVQPAGVTTLQLALDRAGQRLGLRRLLLAL